MLLKTLRIRNFKCFRGVVTLDLGQATYVVGPNNSGKTAVLEALHCFFDTDRFRPEHLNKTELAAKKEGFNRADISVEFDLTQVPGATRKKRVMGKWGDSVVVTKSFTYRETSNTVTVEFNVKGKRLAWEQLDRDLREMIDAVAISYIHPQEGAALLQKAQEKFKSRLFHNWGRHASVAERVKDVQDKWTALRTTANAYLSSSLTSRLREIWPGAEVRVDLPERIQDIVAVSDITFRSSPSLPQVTLTAHGTGAQSAILYQTHYLLDSDRTLHQGPYFPAWLLEEPESFLHADIALQLARLLSSDEWLSSIQMTIATHSAIILAGSRANPDRTNWVLMDAHSIRWQKPVRLVTDSDIREVATVMGDANFPIYFESSSRTAQIYLEDSRQVTVEKFAKMGFPVRGGVNGVTEIKRYLQVLRTVGGSVGADVYFIVDGDGGLKELQPILDESEFVATASGWKKFKVARGVFVVHSPFGHASEDLFEEWPDIVDEAYADIFDTSGAVRKNTPSTLAYAVGKARGRKFASAAEAKEFLKCQDDVKALFWYRSQNFKLRPEHAVAFEQLLPSD